MFGEGGMGVGPTDVFEYQQDPRKNRVIFALSRDFPPVIFNFNEFPQKSAPCYQLGNKLEKSR